MSDGSDTPTPPPASREELIAMVTRSHQDSAYSESALAGRTLAAQSKLPRVIAENLGAGIGQWSFFPEPAEIVDFACAYVPPAVEEDVWAMARAWASDDAASRHTMMSLIGRETLQHELRRIEVPKLRELFDEWRPTRALAMRRELGLDAPAPKAPRGEPKKKAASSPSAEKADKPVRADKPEKSEIPARMPKPKIVRPPKREAGPPAKQYEHPKFGTGSLERMDGVGPEAKLTIRFATGPKTLLARFVTEVAALAPTLE